MYLIGRQISSPRDVAFFPLGICFIYLPVFVLLPSHSLLWKSNRAAQTPTTTNNNNCEWLSLPLSAFNGSPCLSSTKFYYKQLPEKGLCSSLNGVKTSTAWLAPHLFSLMEGGGLVAEWKNTDTQSEWQTCHLITDGPLAFTLMSSRHLLKQGEVKKNQTHQLLEAELLYTKCQAALLLSSELSCLKAGQRVG